MINIFIFYKELNYLEIVSKQISQTNHNIKILGLDTKISDESIEICNKFQPHIIIAEKILHQKLSKVLDFHYIYINITHKDTLSTEKICNQINKFALDFKYSHKIDLYNYRKRILEKLQALQFNLNLCGTHYLVDYITYIHEHPHCSIASKTLYSKIAEKYSSNIESVSWNIHTCIDEMNKYTTDNFRKSIYGTRSKITLQLVINTIAELY